MLEIERKFLVVSDDFKSMAIRKYEICQGYLNSHPARTVRIRIKGESGFLTVKGKSNKTGTTRFEWETEISLLEARPLLSLCEKGTITKTRYEVEVGRHIYEVDVFSGDNEGLIIAELELRKENETFERPSWLGVEVTNDKRYYNAYLNKSPFKYWK